MRQLPQRKQLLPQKQHPRHKTREHFDSQVRQCA